MLTRFEKTLSINHFSIIDNIDWKYNGQFCSTNMYVNTNYLSNYAFSLVTDWCIDCIHQHKLMHIQIHVLRNNLNTTCKAFERMCVCVSVRAAVRTHACVIVRVNACMYVCTCVCVCAYWWITVWTDWAMKMSIVGLHTLERDEWKRWGRGGHHLHVMRMHFLFHFNFHTRLIDASHSGQTSGPIQQLLFVLHYHVRLGYACPNRKKPI